ncbi:MAG: hypothetical protein M0D57_09960 [Sphingobacteriales bacterium JAD_PAG50586_3]|nr:MAG: hypothetical protein M0D57_09960 [Sphingobacteriales bacterium JAD_PAG50586_3]
MESTGLYYLFVSTFSDGNKLVAFVCIAYWFIRKGNFKIKMHKWIVAANNVFLVIGVPLSIKYIFEVSQSLFSDVEYEQYVFANRLTGPYWYAYWLMIFNMVVLPNLLWFKKIRQATWVLPLSILPLLFEWIIMIIASLHRDYLPSTWIMYYPFKSSITNLILYIVLLVGMYYLIEWRKAKRTLV